MPLVAPGVWPQPVTHLRKQAPGVVKLHPRHLSDSGSAPAGYLLVCGPSLTQKVAEPVVAGGANRRKLG